MDEASRRSEWIDPKLAQVGIGQPRPPRPVDWLVDSEHMISMRGAKHPASDELEYALGRLSERLSALLLERLPPDLAQGMLAMLPETQLGRVQLLQDSADAESDSSIGYPTFLERAADVIGADLPEGTLREAVDAFLWGVSTELPADFKARLNEVLPAELKSRMDLYSDRQTENKVA